MTVAVNLSEPGFSDAVAAMRRLHAASRGEDRLPMPYACDIEAVGARFGLNRSESRELWTLAMGATHEAPTVLAEQESAEFFESWHKLHCQGAKVRQAELARLERKQSREVPPSRRVDLLIAAGDDGLTGAEFAQLLWPDRYGADPLKCATAARSSLQCMIDRGTAMLCGDRRHIRACISARNSVAAGTDSRYGQTQVRGRPRHWDGEEGREQVE